MSAPPVSAEAPRDGRREALTLGWRRQAPLVAGFVVLLAVAVASIWVGATSRAYNVQVAHTLRVRAAAYQLLALVQDAETGQRGFLLTENQTYMQPYHEGADHALDALARLEELTHDDETENRSIARLKVLVPAKLKELAATLQIDRTQGVAAAVALIKTNSGNNYMTEIRQRIGEVQDEEAHQMGSDNGQAGGYGTLLSWFSAGGILIVFVLAGLTIVTTQRSTLELKSAQDDLRKTNDNLESIVQDRIADLQAANEEIQRFAYIVSHDLRAPLVNVMGFTSELEAARGEVAALLKAVEREAPQLVTEDCRIAIETDLPESIGFIRTSTAKMDRLINAILRLSREGRRVLTPQSIALRPLIVAQGESLTHQLAEAEATLDISDDLPDLVSDRLAIEQIFGNLLENAVKYLAVGRPGQITVRGRKIGAFLRYEIADNGRGIEKKDFERIFELFRRSGEQDKPGEGIGLAHVRNTVRRLGGNIAVVSEFGKGSTFTITLPAIFSNTDV